MASSLGGCLCALAVDEAAAFDFEKLYLAFVKRLTLADELQCHVDVSVMFTYDLQHLVEKCLIFSIRLDLDCHVRLQVGKRNLPILDLLELRPDRF